MKKLLLLIFLFSSWTTCAQSEKTIVLNDSTKLLLVRDTFEPKGKDIVYWSNSDQALTSIDGHPVFGTDATMPRTQLSSATLVIGDQKIDLDVSGMYDPWADHPDDKPTFVFNKFMDNPARLRGSLGSGAGHYYIEWTVVADKSFRTILTSDSEFICDHETFMRQEEPVDKRG